MHPYDGSAVFDRENNTLTRYSLEEPQSSRPILAGITSILEDRNGALWLGTHGAGLLKYDRDHQRFTRYRHDPDDPDSIAQNNVEHLFADLPPVQGTLRWDWRITAIRATD